MSGWDRSAPSATGRHGEPDGRGGRGDGHGSRLERIRRFRVEVAHGAARHIDLPDARLRIRERAPRWGLPLQVERARIEPVPVGADERGIEAGRRHPEAERGGVGWDVDKHADVARCRRNDLGLDRVSVLRRQPVRHDDRGEDAVDVPRDRRMVDREGRAVRALLPGGDLHREGNWRVERQLDRVRAAEDALLALPGQTKAHRLGGAGPTGQRDRPLACLSRGPPLAFVEAHSLVRRPEQGRQLRLHRAPAFDREERDRL